MVVVEKCRSEAGHMWHMTRIDLFFYPSFCSRFKPFRPSARLQEKEWASLKVTDARPGRDCRWHESYESMELRPGGPDVREWLRENLTGRAIIYIRKEGYSDSFVFSWHSSKQFYAMFANDVDAVKFKLALL